MDKEVRILGRRDGGERPRGLIQKEKQLQLSSRAAIGKLAFGDTKITSVEAQNRTKIMPVIVHAGRRCIGGHDNHRNPESVLIVALHTF